MNENVAEAGVDAPTETDNESSKQLTLHEAQVQTCMCLNRILYLTQDPEIKSFFVSYVTGFSDFDAEYKSLLQNLLAAIAPTVDLQVSAVENAPKPLAWGYEATNDTAQSEEDPDLIPEVMASLRP